MALTEELREALYGPQCRDNCEAICRAMVAEGYTASVVAATGTVAFTKDERASVATYSLIGHAARLAALDALGVEE